MDREAVGQFCCKLLPAAGGAVHLLKGGGMEQSVHVSRCGSAHGVTHGEGGTAIGRGGIPGEGECQALVLELLFCMGEESAPLQFTADAPLWILPGNTGPQVHAETGFRIAAVLTDAHLQGGEE